MQEKGNVMKKKISVIVAVAGNNGIGRDNKLLFRISEDMKRFKQITTGNTVVMGKKTYLSLPVKPLPDRINIVITDVPGEAFEGCVMAYSIEDAINKCNESEENFIIGGASVYSQFLPYADKLYITRINQSFDADCFFPEINRQEWKLISEENRPADCENNFSRSYIICERVKNTR